MNNKKNNNLHMFVVFFSIIMIVLVACCVIINNTNTKSSNIGITITLDDDEYTTTRLEEGDIITINGNEISTIFIESHFYDEDGNEIKVNVKPNMPLVGKADKNGVAVVGPFTVYGLAENDTVILGGIN